jgi:periplasmic glucans biosynthesis protein
MLRRTALQQLAGLISAGLLNPAAGWAKNLARGAPQQFSFDALQSQARTLARQAYSPPRSTLPGAVEAMGWEAYQSIRTRADQALWHGEQRRFEAQFFHLGLYFKSPVRLYELIGDEARELPYAAAVFDLSGSGLDAAQLPSDLGFAGFRLHTDADFSRNVAAFLGASYFRAVGREGQYGLSARGLAIDTAAASPEEFARFTAFWLERPAAGSKRVTVYALLDSPSVAGAYRFVITAGDTLVMDIDAVLYPRATIDRLGIAPCTSMFQTGENDRRVGYDWRSEIHDSDGLAMHTGGGEWIWRPLTNPQRLGLSVFQDHHPRGFGLLQRDRNFDHYQDDGVFYDQRPCLWVEPKGDWGAGAVQLVEIPTADETSDNIVAFWCPARAPRAGEELRFAYRLHWGAQPPVQSPLARCVATRTGLGGVVGAPRRVYAQRFAVDFAGGALAQIAATAGVVPLISASRGRIELPSARVLHAVHGWRAMFDIVPAEGVEPIELRLQLSLGGQVLSETWLYQWLPPRVADRVLF